jgi:putative transposase
VEQTDVMLREHREIAAAKAFFRPAKAVTVITPDRVTIDCHDPYSRAIQTELGKGVRHRSASWVLCPTSRDRFAICRLLSA